MKVGDLSDKKLKIIGISQMLGEQRMHEQSKNFNKDIENIKNTKTEIIEMKNKITLLKNKIEIK